MQLHLPFGIDGDLGLELTEAVAWVSGQVGDEVAAKNKVVELGLHLIAAPWRHPGAQHIRVVLCRHSCVFPDRCVMPTRAPGCGGRCGPWLSGSCGLFG